MVGRSIEPRNALGILFMAAGFFTFSIVDTAAKFLTNDFHPVQIVWIRQFGFLLVVLFLLARFGTVILKTERMGLQIMRGCLAITSATTFIFALRYVAIADAVAVSFVAPFFVTLLGAFWLGEKVGIRRWSAVCLGFVGSLIIIRPGLGTVHPAAFLVVLAALAFALRQILSRILGGVDSTQTTIAYSALVGSGLLLIPLPFVWVTPWSLDQFLILGMVAVLAALAEFLIIRALELAETVAVAPVHYTLMIWGTFWGYFIFGDLPDLWTWVGAGIIMVTGLYTMLRERQLAARITPNATS